MGVRPIWGAEIVSKSCPNCDEANEADAEICFRCGTKFDTSNELSEGEKVAIVIILTILILLILFIALCFLSGVCI